MSARTRSGLLIAAFWTLFGAISGLQIQISMLAHHHSWAALVGYQILVWNVWTLYTFAIGGLLRRVPLRPVRLLPLFFHFGVALAFAVLHTTIWVGAELWLKPYDFMNPTRFGPRYQDVTLCQLPLEILLYGLVALAFHARDAMTRERERDRQAAQLEKSLAEARLHALELQIRPHFLFNTLNGISSLVRAGQSSQAIGMIGGLSDLLRYSLKRTGGTRVPLEEEAAMLERYFAIQRARFGDRLRTEVEIPADATRAAVPVLLLQPLAENAIQHGIEPSGAPGRVQVRAWRDGDLLRIELSNTGKLAASRSEGIGLSATVSRLAQMYGERGRFELLETPEGVVTRVAIPWSTLE
jgi:hypothetical protein